MISDPGQFDKNKTKFKDWWREIRLFLKSDRIIKTDNRIMVILAYLRRGIVGIYAQKKLNELNKKTEIQNWNDFVQEIKRIFSDKTKAIDAEWKIETFKQERKNIVNFIIEFQALAMKVDTNELYAVFLLKKNIQQDIIKIILGYPLIVALETLKKWKITITSVG